VAVSTDSESFEGPCTSTFAFRLAVEAAKETEGRRLFFGQTQLCRCQPMVLALQVKTSLPAMTPTFVTLTFDESFRLRTRTVASEGEWALKEIKAGVSNPGLAEVVQISYYERGKLSS
jgi:hypothetical protein